MPPPVYKETRRIGPDHAPMFYVEVSLDNGEIAVGAASSKRIAEQKAAKNLIEKFSYK